MTQADECLHSDGEPTAGSLLHLLFNSRFCLMKQQAELSSDSVLAFPAS